MHIQKGLLCFPHRLCRVIATFLALVSPVSMVTAVDFTWTGGTSSDFTVGANWGGTAPSPTGGGTASPQPWRISVQSAVNKLVYSAAQGHTVLSGGGSNRSLFIANGSNVSGAMSITGGIFESTSSAPDGMLNGTNVTGLLSIDGGIYRKINGPNTVFAVRYAGDGNSQATLDINSGSFEVGTLDLQNANATSTLATGVAESIVNLDGGTLSTGVITRSVSSTGIDAVLNFNGGTLQARQNSTSFLNALQFFTANVQAGGAVVDSNGFNITIAAPLVHDAALGSIVDGGLTKKGSGTLTLTGINTYTGGTFVKDGTLALGAGNDRLPTGTVVTLGDASANTSGIVKLDGRSQMVAGLATAGSGTNNRIVNGNLTSAILTVNTATGATSTFSGSLGGSGTNENNLSLTKSGAGSLVLTGENTYAGVTTVSSGTLQFANVVSLYGGNTANWATSNIIVSSGATLAFNVGGAGEFAAGDIDTLKSLGNASGGFLSGSSLGLDTSHANGGEFIYSSSIGNTNSGANVLGVTKLGSNTLTLNAANTYTGPTVISGGTLKAGAGSGASAFGNNSVVTLGNVAGVVLDLNGYNQSIGSLVGGGTTGGKVQLNGATLTTGGNNANATFAGVIEGAGGLTKAGTGIQTLSGSNTYTGLTSVNAGNILVANNDALGATGVGNGTVVANGAAVVLAHGVAVSGEAIAIAGSGTANSGGLQAAAGATASWSGDITLDAGARVGALAGGTLTLSGVIKNGTGTALQVSGENGTGTVVVSGASNAYSGPTQIVRGVLRLAINNGLSTATSLDVDYSSAGEDATFDLGGFNQAVSSLTRSGSGSGTGGSFITNTGTAASTLEVNQAGTSVYNGVIQNGSFALNITKTGSGSLTLSGNNSYTGTTTLSGSNSELIVGSNTALGSTLGGTTVGNGARLVLANGVIVTGETVTITGSGGNNNGAVQTAAGASAEWAGNMVIVAGSEVRIGGGNNGTLTISGVISGPSNSSIVFSR